MPYCSLQTNLPLADEMAQNVMARLSAAVADITGKPESVVQVAVQPGVQMMMAANREPTAFVNVKGINLAPDAHGRLSRRICDILAETLSLDGKRVYLLFETFSAAQWGRDGRTF